MPTKTRISVACLCCVSMLRMKPSSLPFGPMTTSSSSSAKMPEGRDSIKLRTGWLSMKGTWS